MADELQSSIQMMIVSRGRVVTLAFGSVLAAVTLTLVAPASAQDVTPGLTIVGHGPDVPNAEPAACATGTPACPRAVVEPSMLVIVVPVPILVPLCSHHHRGDVASTPADAAFNNPNPPNPTGRFINDPARRFVNPPVRLSPSQNESLRTNHP